MADREIFKDNLNFYLKDQKKKQKDLAEYVGAKTTTVSGWTRGVSYPRADAMEKIAMFFGIPTSRLVGDRNGSNEAVGRIVIPDTVTFRQIAAEMTPDDYEMVMEVFERTYKRMQEEGKV